MQTQASGTYVFSQADSSAQVFASGGTGAAVSTDRSSKSKGKEKAPSCKPSFQPPRKPHNFDDDSDDDFA